MDAPVETTARGNRRLALQLAAVAVAMFGFGYLLVPMYTLLCEIAGIRSPAAAQTEAAAVEVAPPPDQKDPRIAYREHADSKTALKLAFRAPGDHHRDEPAAELLLRVLDDGMSTRLYERICDEKGLCYDVSAGYEAYSDAGLFDVAAETAHERAELVLAELLNVLRELRDDGPTQRELDKAKTRLRWHLTEMLDLIALALSRVAPIYVPDAASGAPRIGDLAAAIGLDQSPVAAACTELQGRGLVLIEETPYDELSLGKDAEPFVHHPLPERLIVDVLLAQGGRCKVTEVPNHCPLNASQVGQSLRFLTQRGWAEKQGDTLVLTEAGKAAKGHRTPDENLLTALAGWGLGQWGALSFGWPFVALLGLVYRSATAPQVEDVSGLVQVGYQSHADRYTYVPLVGVFTAIAFGAAEIARRGRGARLAVATVGAAALLYALLAPLSIVFVSPMLFALMGPAHGIYGRRAARQREALEAQAVHEAAAAGSA